MIKREWEYIVSQGDLVGLKFKSYGLSNVDAEWLETEIDKINENLSFCRVSVSKDTNSITGYKQGVSKGQILDLELDRYGNHLIQRVLVDTDTTLADLYLRRVIVKSVSSSLRGLDDLIERVEKFKCRLLNTDIELCSDVISTYANLTYHRELKEELYTLEGLKIVEDRVFYKRKQRGQFNLNIKNKI